MSQEETKIKIKKSVREYFSQEKFFLIPCYQRGYKWGVPFSKDSSKCAVSVLLEDLLRAKEGNQKEYFLQGVTVYEKDQDVVLIDGQQRTTTLFLILSALLDEESKKELLLCDNKAKLRYTIRNQSQSFIDFKLGLKSIGQEEEADLIRNYQDIYYFDKCLKTLQNCSETEKSTLTEFILNHVYLFYIKVEEKKSANIFSMLNGNKAFMTVEELIKADLLSKASRNDIQEDKLTEKQEWEINVTRSRLSREWDRWVYWWNRKDVRAFFNSGNNPLGLLIEYYYRDILNNTHKQKDIYFDRRKESVGTMFKQFQAQHLSNSVKSKQTFLKLRDLQKRFEDLYNDCRSYNYLGMALKCGESYYTVLSFFLKNYKDTAAQKRYSYCTLLKIPHNQIVGGEDAKEAEKKAVKDAVAGMLHRISSPSVYWDEENEFRDFTDNRKEDVYRQLLRLNLEQDNLLGRKFDFDIWNNRSLEHIHPKSRVFTLDSNHRKVRCSDNLLLDDVEGYYIENGKCLSIKDDMELSEHDLLRKDFYICRSQFGELTEHSIGNLVLLYGTDNSEFGNKSFQEKKNKYFTITQDKKDKIFKSLSLLHSISVFANSSWDQSRIRENQKTILERIKNDYALY